MLSLIYYNKYPPGTDQIIFRFHDNFDKNKELFVVNKLPFDRLVKLVPDSPKLTKFLSNA